MPTVLLVRHAQASFGGPDYDVLSPRGREQAEAVARELAARPLDVARLLTGSLRRQRETAEPAAALLARPVLVDPRWNEYEMDAILATHSTTPVRADLEPGSRQAPVPAAEFQDLLEAAISSWIEAAADGPAAETWPSFAGRVRAALRDAVGGLPAGSTALVFTSGGVVAAVCAALMELPPPALIMFNRVSVNTGITKLVTGRRGVTVVSFNEHTHLEHSRPSLVTYR
ncbi:MAG: histidine phosphatase family protein [Solirubrobacteraceae bacterium]